jgi:hypothetical protein
MDLVRGRLDVPVARTQAQRKQRKDERRDESDFHVLSFVDGLSVPERNATEYCSSKVSGNFPISAARSIGTPTCEAIFATHITRYRFLVSYFCKGSKRWNPNLTEK